MKKIYESDSAKIVFEVQYSGDSLFTYEYRRTYDGYSFIELQFFFPLTLNKNHLSRESEKCTQKYDEEYKKYQEEQRKYQEEQNKPVNRLKNYFGF